VLQHAGLQPYLPTLTTRRTKRGRTTVHPVQMFTGYCFGWSELWTRLPYHSALIGYVRVGGQPATVSDDIIAEIARVAKASNGHDPTNGLRPGQRVKITTGPMASKRGRFDGLGPGARVRVLLDILGRATPVLLEPTTEVTPDTEPNQAEAA
jgi:transcriptional antiterminator RfaH